MMIDTPQGYEDDAHDRGAEARLLTTLERLLELDTTHVSETLNGVAQLVGEALGAEKVDLFLYHPENHTLQVAGISATPMSKRQVELGLDRIPLADGGRLVEVFETGNVYLTGHADADQDTRVMRGITEGLGVRSLLAVALNVGDERRGVLQAASALEDAFSAQDCRFFLAVGTWVGVLVQRAELVESMRESATQAARRLAADELITVLAHDLRNLISPISLRLQLLHRQIERKGRTREGKDIQGILSSVTRLQWLVMNLLDTARLDQGLFFIEPETCDLTALVKATVALMHVPSTPIDVRADSHVIVQADPARLRQVIENLVENALHHAPSGTSVSVAVATESEQHVEDGTEASEWAAVIVQDEGPGIPTDLLPHLFERYAKGQSSLGMGLGLYVSHEIVQAHGGTLTAESKPRQGARFTVRLPLVADELDAAHR